MSDKNFKVKDLADCVNMSQTTLYRKVKLITALSVIELIRNVRLKRAAVLLKCHRYSIQEVSEMVGYNDIPTFRKHFTEFFGKVPSAYAK
ncbi:helix-turn-helix domain-containing protein [Parabacteroides chinchillae]|uniref:helix-turn-helix domain-containing protein n=1 Tax=Parabacteroides chinchillae TaxID=871327 RepID=UPI001F1BB1E3|nr:helix-turn-helix transcriptional regulator [Parabacteroides chinchillae]